MYFNIHVYILNFDYDADKLVTLANNLFNAFY